MKTVDGIQTGQPICGHEECQYPIYTQSGYARQRGRGCNYETMSARLVTKLLVSLGVIEKGIRVRVQRAYPGWSQRAAGAWSWWAESEKKPWGEIAGSQWSVREIIQMHKRGKILVDTSPETHVVDLSPV